MLNQDSSSSANQDAGSQVLDTRFVAVAFVVIATVIPSELRLATDPFVVLDVWTHDVPINLALYVPLGLTLARWGGLRVVGTAVALSVTAEAIQLLFPYRLSQPTDVLFNALGALFGFSLARLLKIDLEQIPLGRGVGLVAALLSVIWLASCPAICSHVGGLDPPFETFLDKPAYGRGGLNATVQLAFALCHRKPTPNAALVGMLLALAFLGLVRARDPRLRWVTGATGGAVGGALVWMVWSDPGYDLWPIAVGLIAGVASTTAVRIRD
jgi:VanZ family protein